MGFLEAVFLRGIALKHRTPSAEKKPPRLLLALCPVRERLYAVI